MISAHRPTFPGTKLLYYWLFVTAPSIIFFLTLLGEFLATPPPPALTNFFIGGAIYAGLALAMAVAAFWLFGKKSWVEPVFLGVSLAAAIALVNIAAPGLAHGIDVQKFMVTCSPLFAPILYSLSGLSRLVRRPASASVSFLIALLASFLLAQATLALLIPLARTQGEAILPVGTIALSLVSVVFYFFFQRGLTRWYDGLKEKKISAAVLLLFAGLLPVSGLLALLLTQASFSGSFGFSLSGFIPGDYIAGFFIPLLFAPIAGLLLAVRPRASRRAALAAYLLRLALVPYSLYLFLAALPYLAFAPVLIMFLGLGLSFALVSGMCLVHVRRLIDDYRRVKIALSPSAARVPLLLLAVFPLLVTGLAVHDRTALAAAYDYVTGTRYDLAAPAVSGATLARINQFSGRAGWPNNLPVIGPLYNGLVFQGKPIAPETGELIAQVFLGENPAPLIREPWNDRNPAWTAESDTIYRPGAGDFLSKVTLSMTNGSSDKNEFVASFSIPTGARVSGLELEINGQFRQAIRVKKTTALFAYENIVHRSRDPAILYYASGDTVRFRVFPFAPRETRRAEISFLHLAPFTLEIETESGVSRSIRLEPAPGTVRPASVIASPVDTVYLTAEYKRSLPSVKREPYFHFILDVSSGDPNSMAMNASKVAALLSRYPALAVQAEVSLVNAGVETHPVAAPWRALLKDARPKTGFCLERALRSVYGDPDRSTAPRYPVVVVVSSDPGRALYRRSLADCRALFPESDDYFLLDGGQLLRRDLTVHPALDETTGTLSDFHNRPVRAFHDSRGQTYFVRADREGSLVFQTRRAGPLAAPASASPLFPFLRREYDAAVFSAPAPAPTSSPDATLLARDSSFIVLESEKDDQAVLAADREVPKADKLFSMDEPDPLVWLLIAGAILTLGAGVKTIVRRRKRRAKNIPVGAVQEPRSRG